MDGAFGIGAKSGLKGGYKMKKFLSIALAIVFIMGMRPLTANACEGNDHEHGRDVCFIDEVIMPRVALCRCGGVGRYVNDSYTVVGGPCPENSRYAHHGTTYKGILMFCQECDTFLGPVRDQSCALQYCDNYQSGPCFKPYYLWNNTGCP